eukprot:5536334-Pyramimonas_sp.AAC.1
MARPCTVLRITSSARASEAAKPHSCVWTGRWRSSSVASVSSAACPTSSAHRCAGPTQRIDMSSTSSRGVTVVHIAVSRRIDL